LVAPDSPAAEAGLLSGDIIVAIDDAATRSAGQLRNQIGMHEIGDKVELTIVRDGKEISLKVKVGKPQDIGTASSGIHRLLEGAQFEENAQGDGIVVTNIAPNSPAAYNGLRIGDIIISANKIKVRTIKDLSQALAKDDNKMLLQIQRGFASLFLVIQ
jgi:S1-C subfamily serine protease